MIDFICFNDEHGNIYKLCEHDKDFYVKKDTAKIFEGQLIKLKSIDKVPIKPYIYKNNLFLFNYDRGIEIHKLDGTEKNSSTHALASTLLSQMTFFLLKEHRHCSQSI